MLFFIFKIYFFSKSKNFQDQGQDPQADSGHLCAQEELHFQSMGLKDQRSTYRIPFQSIILPQNITPIHTAAINPDSAFLAALRDVDPVINVPDQNNW